MNRYQSESTVSIRVLLADDSEIVRQAITSVLMGDPEIQVVGEAVTFAQAIKLTHELQPRVILIDLHMRDRDGVTPLQRGSADFLCADDPLQVAIFRWVRIRPGSGG